MLVSDFAVFKKCLLSEQRLHFSVKNSEPMKFDGLRRSYPAIHQRITFDDPDEFEVFYQQLLMYCMDHDGYIVATSLNSLAVTVLLEVD